MNCIGNLKPESEEDLCGITVSIMVVTRRNSFTGRNGEVFEGEVNDVIRIDTCLPGSNNKHGKAEA
jgi:hypothetical protein